MIVYKLVVDLMLVNQGAKAPIGVMRESLKILIDSRNKEQV